MFFSGSRSGSGGGLSFAFVTGFVTMCSGPSLAPWFAGFTVPARPTLDNRNGRLLYPVRAVRCSWSAWAVHRLRCEPFLLPQEGSSFSVSFWLRMRGHGGAGSWSRNGLFCVPWAWCARSVAPYLLCEELAVILVDGCGCGARAHPSLLSLGSPHPSTGSVWSLSGTRVDPVLLTWTYQ